MDAEGPGVMYAQWDVRIPVWNELLPPPHELVHETEDTVISEILN
jgi:hypothetical protein